MKSKILPTPGLLALVGQSLTQPAPPQACPDRDRSGPWDSDVLVYRVSADVSTEKLATFARAGVATVTRLKDGRLLAADRTSRKKAGLRRAA